MGALRCVTWRTRDVHLTTPEPRCSTNYHIWSQFAILQIFPRIVSKNRFDKRFVFRTVTELCFPPFSVDFATRLTSVPVHLATIVND